MIADADESVAPISYRVDVTRRVVYFTLRGDVTFAGMCAAQDAYLADPLYEPGMAIYVDCRVLTSIPSREEIRKMALDRLYRGVAMPTGRAAIVVMTKMGQEYAAAWELFAGPQEGALSIFTTHAEAHAWLGVPVPKTLD